MAESTHTALRAHMKKWQSEGQPGFNCNPIDALREEVRWLCSRIDEPLAQENALQRITRVLNEGKVPGG